MFQDLDSTLEALLRTQLPAEVVNQVTISFATPVNGALPASVALPAINLFLYQIDENRDLRDNDRYINRMGDGSAVRSARIKRVDCIYLVTAWAKESVSHPEQDEHRLLGDVMRVLLGIEQLPAEVLRGSMADQVIPPRALPFQTNQQARSDFWRALGEKPKAAFNYVVTIAVTVDAAKTVGRVADKVLI